MTKIKIGILTSLVAVVATIAFLFHGKDMTLPLNAAPMVQNRQGLRLEIPDALWEPAFFEALEKRTKQISLPSLRTVVLPEDDLEVRFWYDHFEVISGLIIKRSGEKWSATYLRQIYDHQPSSIKQEDVGAPKSGWQAAWGRLLNAGILTLPDSSKAKCKAIVLDGIGYVVETNVDQAYRTYRYGNPQFAECDEAKRIISIEEIIADEFGLHGAQK